MPFTNGFFGIRYPFLRAGRIQSLDCEYPALSIQSGEGELRLSQKYAFIKKSTIFTKSIRNFVKKKGTRECLILTKFCNGRVKIVDFLIKAYF